MLEIDASDREALAGAEEDLGSPEARRPKLGDGILAHQPAAVNPDEIARFDPTLELSDRSPHEV